MVVRMMKWLPWPPASSRKFQVYLTIHALEGIFPPSDSSGRSGDSEGIMVDVKWKGPKGSFFRRRSLKRDRTTEKRPDDDGIVSWEEESGYECVCVAKNNGFQPWDVHFVVLRAMHQGGKVKLSVAGTAIMNIADFISTAEDTRQTTKISITRSSTGETEAALVVTLSFVELRANSESGSDIVHRSPLPCISSPSIYNKDFQHSDGEAVSETFKTAKRPAEGKASQELYVVDRSKLSSSSEGSSCGSGALFDSDSIDDYDEERVDNEEDSSFRKSFSYGTLAGVNLVLEGALPSFREGEIHADRSASIHSRVETDAIPNISDEALTSDPKQAGAQHVGAQQTVRSLLSWKKRKLGFRSPRARGEPLLNKSYGDDGGDDIDHDRRQSCSSPIEQLLSLGWNTASTTTTNVSECLDFGEEEFTVGSWEKKELISRDGNLKLSANVFFASIDQRNERAAGESACTALVAVIADWLHQNPNRMPIRTEFDTLIREGSAEWRQLRDIEAYRDHFPDGHFDLDTVLQAKVRHLKVAPERSFVGFFQPEGLGDSYDFLQGAMSFDSIWDAIVEENVAVKAKDCFEPAVYIVSWNDHFFILKVDVDAFYIIDTLGERLYEGCDQAYIIRFDSEARLSHASGVQTENNENNVPQASPLRSPEPACSPKSCPSEPLNELDVHTVEEGSSNEGDNKDDRPIYEGREACKQFLKGFFAAVPLRELQIDIKKGLLGKFPLHQRLQIEFHFVALDLPALDVKATCSERLTNGGKC